MCLEALFERLPIHPRRNCSQALSDRSYFCDAEGWVSKLLNDAMQAGRRSAEEVSAMGENAGARAREAATGLPCEGEAIMHMRFLIYAEAGGGCRRTLISAARGAMGKCRAAPFSST